MSNQTCVARSNVYGTARSSAQAVILVDRRCSPTSMAAALRCFMMLLPGLAAVRDMNYQELDSTNAQLVLQIDSLTHTVKELGFQYFGVSANASFAKLDAKLAHGRDNTEFLKAALEESRQRLEDLRVHLGYAKTSRTCQPREGVPKVLLSECKSAGDCTESRLVGERCSQSTCDCFGTVYNTCKCRR